MRFSARVFSLAMLWPIIASGQRQNSAPAQPSPSPSPAVIEVPKSTDKIMDKSSQPSPKPAIPPSVSGGGIQILSDIKGVDFREYVKRLKLKVQTHWYQLMPRSALPPESKSGKVILSFSIMRDGSVQDLKVDAPSGDAEFDRAAFVAVRYSSPFAALPLAYKNESLKLRTRFYYNPAAGEVTHSGKEGEQKTVPDPVLSAKP